MGVVSTKVFLEDYEVDINIGIHEFEKTGPQRIVCLLYTSPSPRDGLLSRMPSSA